MESIFAVVSESTLWIPDSTMIPPPDVDGPARCRKKIPVTRNAPRQHPPVLYCTAVLYYAVTYRFYVKIAPGLMATSSILLLFCAFLASSGSATPTVRDGRANYLGPLPRALGSPVNVDSDVDCAIKVLAWEYAKKILPRVSLYINLGAC